MKTIIKVVFSLLLMLGMFLTLEVVGWYQLRTDIYQGDQGYFWKLKPRIAVDIDYPTSFRLETNSDGFRMPERSGKHPMILLLGCSTTLGWGVDVEDTFVHALGEAFPNAEIVNGGQPGWSTHQIIQNLSEFQQWQPDIVLVGVGVRDAQVANRIDAEARPTPWLLRRYAVRWLQSMQRSGTGTVTTPSGSTVRVPPEQFTKNLGIIKQSFTGAEVYFYMFPQQEISIAHAKIVDSQNHLIAPRLSEDAYFENDPIHLNISGHQQFSNWLIPQVEPILTRVANLPRYR